MKHIKVFEGWFSKKSEPLTKSDFTYSKMGISKIDSSKKIKLAGYMKCPKCRTEMKELGHGEIGRCKECKTEMQVFGNALYVNNIDRTAYSHYEVPGYEYSKDYTKEKLMASDYERGNQMYCPLCHKILDKIFHSGVCKECGLEMRVSGNALYCKIDNEKLELYSTIKKYNL